MRCHFLFLTITLGLITALMIGSSSADLKFTDATAQAGINNTARGACVAFADYNGDGYIDIYVGNSGKNGDDFGKPNLLYRNNGDGTFTDVAVEAGVADERQTLGVAFGDFDNDGDPDLYIANDFGLNALYINKGDGSFEDIAEAAGVVGSIDMLGEDEVPNGYGTALADVDNDGFLDIYVVNLGGTNILYRNNGNGTFTNITEQASVQGGNAVQGLGTAAVFSDCNGDGKPDLYAINAMGLPCFFYLNKGGNFEDATEKAGIGDLGDAAAAVFGDYDNDGDMDLYVTNCQGANGGPLPNVLYRNDGKGIFEDVTAEAGVGGEDYTFGAAFGDFDSDGYLDLYVVTNGGPNVLYRNNGDGTFTDVTQAAGVDDFGWGSNAALGDVNNDGYLDIYLANSGLPGEEEGDPDVLYLNDGGTNHWLKVNLVGVISNHTGIGARIELSAGDLHQVREIDGGRGYAQNSNIASFGLSDHTIVDSITVKWPSGILQTLENINADQLIVIEEGNSASVDPAGKIISTWAEAKRAGTESGQLPESLSSFVGQNYPNPFNPETWIPYQLSQDNKVVIIIYSSTGQLVRKLDLGHRTTGAYLSQADAAYWDGKNLAGEEVASGIYFYCIQAGGFTETRKMLLVR